MKSIKTLGLIIFSLFCLSSLSVFSQEKQNPSDLAHYSKGQILLTGQPTIGYLGRIRDAFGDLDTGGFSLGLDVISGYFISNQLMIGIGGRYYSNVQKVAYPLREYDIRILGRKYFGSKRFVFFAETGLSREWKQFYSFRTSNPLQKQSSVNLLIGPGISWVPNKKRMVLESSILAKINFSNKEINIVPRIAVGLRIF